MFSTLIDQFWSLTLSGIALGFIYVLISLGYTMVYGVLRLINFAHSEIFMVGNRIGDYNPKFNASNISKGITNAKFDTAEATKCRGLVRFSPIC